MKKLRLRLGVLGLIFLICMCFCLVACGDKDSGGNNGGNKSDGKDPVASALAAPTVVVDDNGKATWAEVTNASGYVFKIDGGTEQTAQNREVQLQDGQSVVVKAKGDGVRYTDSEWSNAVTYTASVITPVVDPVKLSAPMVTIGIDGKATWSNVANASGYVFKIDGGAEQTAQNREVLLENNQSIAVKAKGDGVSYTDSDWSNAVTYKAPTSKLAAPENLTVAIQGTDAGKVILSWNAVAAACGYRYSVNGVENHGIVFDNTVTINLAAIDATKLDNTWTFQVKANGEDGERADDGDYSDWYAASDYCTAVEFSVSNDDIYTAAEIIKIANYYGENFPDREFMVAGTVQSNADGAAVLENGFTLFGDYVPELYLAIDDRLEDLEATAMGTLAAKGEAKGLRVSSVDFEDIEEDDRYDLVIATLNAWDMLKEDSKIMGDFRLPVRFYGVNMLWSVYDDGDGAIALDNGGNVTVTCPASDEGDVLVMITVMMYIDETHDYDGELDFMFYVAHDTRTPLDAPKININPKTGVATWTKIEHATGYRVTYYGFSVPGNYYSDYVSEDISIAAEGNRLVQLKDTWWITVQALGDSTTYGNSDIASKQYNYYPETVEPDGTPLVFDLTELTQTGNLANPKYIFGLACHDSDIFVGASAERDVLGNDDFNGAVMGTGFIKVGSSSNKGKITLNFNKKILGVVITARQWNKDQNDKVSVNGSDQQTASKNDWGIMYFNFTANKASNTVTIDTDNRVFIQKITVYVAD